MFHRIQRALQFRAFIVFGLIHVGLIASLVALVQAAKAGVESGILYWMIGATVGLYGGVLAGIFFVIWPALPWIRRARRVMQWRETLLSDLPRLLALLPVLIQLVKTLRDAWRGFNEEKDSGPSGASTSDSIRKLSDAIVQAVQTAQETSKMGARSGRPGPHEVA